ncbi:citrate synthase 5, mitochondrial [Cyclospora cayetanensis]|uniref:Citrate synthase n=1 Tax=Cyclospora cayetanensis TaxID=88456 RepID=A0A6P6S518_9EIME|nr:citrate synthase 5, mitochondrial [Cyclospora cayetanensis]
MRTSRTQSSGVYIARWPLSLGAKSAGKNISSTKTTAVIHNLSGPGGKSGDAACSIQAQEVTETEEYAWQYSLAQAAADAFFVGLPASKIQLQCAGPIPKTGAAPPAAAGTGIYRSWTAATVRAKEAAVVLAPTGLCVSRRPLTSSSRIRGPTQGDSPAAAVRATVEALQDQLSVTAAEKQKHLQRIKQECGAVQIGIVTPQNVTGGMRGLTALLTETSVLDPETGLKLHGVQMQQLLQKELPKIDPGHEYPSVEALLWFLLTSKVPTAAQVALLQRCLYEMSVSAAASVSKAGVPCEGPTTLESYTEERFLRVPTVVSALLDALPATGHPMAAFAAAAAAQSDFSFFRATTESGTVAKKDLWKPALVDALALVARAAVTAAHIYRRKFADGHVFPPDPNLDFAANFARMLGFSGEKPEELMRLYLLLHADHEGGNVSAHAAHLVGSALADPFSALAAGMAGLGGPLHGLANQKCLAWLRSVQQRLEGSPPTKEKIRDIALATLKSGNVIPGFGHAVLRVTDPRFSLQHEFALRHIQNDPLFKLLDVVRVVVPEILSGKVSNPYPNVDCHSGVLLQAFGLTQEQFYTVLFGVSRSMGIAAQFVWARALGLPIERPKSVTLKCLEQLCAEAKH